MEQVNFTNIKSDKTKDTQEEDSEKDSINILKKDINSLTRVLYCYRRLIRDLTENKVQNFNDRIRNLKKIESNEDIDYILQNIDEKIIKFTKELNN